MEAPSSSAIPSDNRPSSTSSSSPPHPDMKSKVLKRLSFPLTWSNQDSEDTIPKYKSLINLEQIQQKANLIDFKHGLERLLPSPTPAAPPAAPPTSTSSCTTGSFTSCLSSTSDDPWFLCLTCGYNPNTKPKYGHMVSYGQKSILKPEYWFGIHSQQQVEELYRFWLTWWPQLYG